MGWGGGGEIRDKKQEEDAELLLTEEHSRAGSARCGSDLGF